MTKPAKQAKPVDLSEYAEEAVPFDTVIRKLGRVKPAKLDTTPPKKTKKRAK